MPGGSPRDGEGDRTSLRVYTGIPGIPYNTKRTAKNDVPKSLKDMLKPHWKGKIASTPYVTSLNILAAKEMWGKEAALEYVRQLSKQVTGLIRHEAPGRLRRILAFSWMFRLATFEAQAHGAPVEMSARPRRHAAHRLLAIPKNARTQRRQTCSHLQEKGKRAIPVGRIQI